MLPFFLHSFLSLGSNHESCRQISNSEFKWLLYFVLEAVQAQNPPLQSYVVEKISRTRFSIHLVNAAKTPVDFGFETIFLVSCEM